MMFFQKNEMMTYYFVKIAIITPIEPEKEKWITFFLYQLSILCTPADFREISVSDIRNMFYT